MMTVIKLSIIVFRLEMAATAASVILVAPIPQHVSATDRGHIRCGKQAATAKVAHVVLT